MKYLLIFFIVSLSLASCEVINPDEEIPCYLKIENAVLETDESTQGAPTVNVNDIWVNIDGTKQGIYELPVNFPLLSSGTHNMILRAGIKNNGIAASRKIYPFFDFYEADINFIPDSLYLIQPVFHYKSETVFTWLENFEDAGITLNRHSVSDTTLNVIADADQVNNNVGQFVIDDTKYRFFYESSDSFPRPASGSEVYLELDYKNDESLIVGFKLIRAQYATYEALISLNPKSTKNKIYIDLGSFLTSSTDVLYYRLYFYAIKQNSAAKSEFSIDNIKLLQF